MWSRTWNENMYIASAKNFHFEAEQRKILFLLNKGGKYAIFETSFSKDPWTRKHSRNSSNEEIYVVFGWI